MGVNTGEVVTGSDEWLATGDAVNVAARFQQVAKPGEILLGGDTVRLVRDAVEVEPLEALELKGKSQAVSSYRLLGLSVEKAEMEHPLQGRLVGRDHQLRVLQEAFASTVHGSTCSLFTLLGSAGVGKSRLAAEFLAGSDALVLRGRCLPYGEGITYFPVVEIVKQLLGHEPDSHAAQLLRSDASAITAIQTLLGETSVATSGGEIAWAVRKLLEAAAIRQPLVALFDDLHWGEPALFDLVEHVAEFSREAPIFLLCLARSDLLERRPGWGGGKLNSTTLLLEPLNADETTELIDDLAGQDGFNPELGDRIRTAAEGNPLFIEEMLAMVRESGGGQLIVPPTIKALLAARLDQLDPAERVVLERGSVEGQTFHRRAVEALAPEQRDVASHLMTLVRKELIRPGHSDLASEDAFRFRHLLIRDAAYDSLPKAHRAELHERFARWWDERSGDRIERDEIVAYHFERAYRYRAELGPLDDDAFLLASTAAGRLEAAGRRALDRGDEAAAVNLLERASALLPSERPNVALEVALAQALYYSGRPSEAVARARNAADRAAVAGDRLGELRARLAPLQTQDAELFSPRAAELVEEARQILEEAGDQGALASLWAAIGWREDLLCRSGVAFEARRCAITYAQAAGERYLERRIRTDAARDAVRGPLPIREALAWLDQAEASTASYDGWFDRWRSLLLAYLGRFEEARSLSARATEGMRERGMTFAAILGAQSDFWIESLADDVTRAEALARAACQLLGEIGERDYYGTLAELLAHALYELGHDKEAEEWVDRGTAASNPHDVITHLLGGSVRAKLLARKGELSAAEAEAADAVNMAERTEFPVMYGNALCDYAEVLLLAGKEEQAAEQLRRAIKQYEAKGAVACIDRARDRFQRLAAGQVPV